MLDYLAVLMPIEVIIKMDGIPINFQLICMKLLKQCWLFLKAGGLTTGGINFDAKTRRNSTDLEDLFISHISGMDVFARSLLIADDILKNSDYNQIGKQTICKL